MKNQDPRQTSRLEVDEDSVSLLCSRQKYALLRDLSVKNILTRPYDALSRFFIAIAEDLGLHERPLCRGFVRLKWFCVSF